MKTKLFFAILFVIILFNACKDEDLNTKMVRYVVYSDDNNQKLSVKYLTNAGLITIDTISSPFSVNEILVTKTADISAGIIDENLGKNLYIEIYVNDKLLEHKKGKYFVFSSVNIE